ncbi:MAG TPA: WYL domain-containing protein [Ktedonobacteraceae bacterium]|nr:WYL domain-containing protein [Ktedonobacteraceae bacterium]
MQRFDRILGLLLFLRSGQTVSAEALAQHFRVSRRTIYRDMESLSLLGVPLYAERGREGGFQLLEGYFLPPLMFSQGEAVALLLGLALQKNLRSRPFPEELFMAEKKLVAALPERLQKVLAKSELIMGVEQLPKDLFHPESGFASRETPAGKENRSESRVISVFLQAILDKKQIIFQYPTRNKEQSYEVQAAARGIFWDRNHWYLVGQRSEQPATRMWRSDRVMGIRLIQQSTAPQADFDVREMLGRKWLSSAIEQWSQQSPVKISLTPRLATRLQQDWYYQHATFETVSEEKVLMTFGESDPMIVLELLRWLGPEAELIEPQMWRNRLREELQQMWTKYL